MKKGLGAPKCEQKGVSVSCARPSQKGSKTLAKDLLIKVKWKFQNIEFEKKGIRNQAAEQFKIERAAGQGGIWYRFRPVSVCLDKQLPRRNKYAGTC